MNKKKLKKISGLLALGLLFCGCGKDKRYEDVDVYENRNGLGRALEHIDENPEHRDFIVNYIIGANEKDYTGYSEKTMSNLSHIVTLNALVYPDKMKDVILDIAQIGLRSRYRDEIWDELTPEEMWVISKGAVEYKTKKAYGVVGELSVDVYHKLKETKLYDEIKKMEKELSRK